MAKAPINVSIAGDYNDKDINRAIRDLNSLKTGSSQTAGPMAQLGVAGVAMGAAIGGAALAAAAAVGRMAVSFAVDGVQSAISLNETINKSAVVFGDAQQSIIKFADTAVTNLGQTRAQAIDAASGFAIFGKSAGLTGQDLSKFSTDLVSLSADLSSFHNAAPDEVIMALGSALRGEAEPMRRFGVLLDDAALKAQAMAMGIYEGTGSLTQQQKVLSAQALILKQTTDAQGDFARTSDGLANQTRVLSAAFVELQTAFGIGFLEGLGDTSSGVNGLQQAMQNAEPGVRQLGVTAANATVGVVDLAGALGRADMATQEFGRRITSSFSLNLIALGNAFGVVTDKQFLAAQADRDYYIQTGKTTRAVGGNFNAIQLQQRALTKLEGEYVTASGAAAGFEAAQSNMAVAISAASQTILDQFSAISNLDQDMQDAATRAGALAVADDNLRLESDRAAVAVTGLGSSTGGAARDLYTFKEALAEVNEAGLEKLYANLKAAEDEFAAFRTSISGAISGQLDFGSAIDEAKKGGTGIVAGIASQADGIVAFGEQLLALLETSLSEEAFLAVSALTAERGAALATELLGANGAALIAQLNTSVEAVNAVAEAVGIQSAGKFKGAGVITAEATIAGFQEFMGKDGIGRKQLMKTMDNLADAATRQVRIDVMVTRSINEIVTQIRQNITGPQAREHGGPVSSGRSYMVGEAGPELFTPSRSGNITPNSAMGGNTYNINVNAGVGDPRAIGQQIVEYVKKFEKANGPVFVAA